MSQSKRRNYKVRLEVTYNHERDRWTVKASERMKGQWVQSWVRIQADTAFSAMMNVALQLDLYKDLVDP